MKMMIFSMGTRGDVQPLIALGKGLQAAQIDFTLVVGSNFRDWLEDEGLPFADLGVDMQAMMSSPAGQNWIENSSSNPLNEMRHMHKMVTDNALSMGEASLQLCQQADMLVSNLPTFSFVYSVAQKLNKPLINILLQPMKPTRLADSTLRPIIPRHSNPLNLISGYMGLAFLWQIFADGTNQIRREILDMPPLTRGEFIGAWNRTPTIHGISPLVAPNAPDWSANTYTSGYWFLDQPDWQPSAELSAFLEAGSAPVYLGFGSMSSSTAEQTASIMIEALQRTGQRGIIASGWGGLKTSHVPDNIFLLDAAPHDWLFPQMTAAVHHGGSGTTAAALRAGIPSTVVPHMGDQPYWGRRVHELGVGPKMIPRHQLTADRLTQAIQQMVNDSSMRQKARELGGKIQQERGVENGVQALQAILKNLPDAQPQKKVYA